jgi:uncharacterized protein
MAISSPTAPMPRRTESGFRLPGWLAAVVAVLLVAVAGGVGALLMAQVAGRPVTLQLPGQTASAVPNLLTVQGVGRVSAVPDTMLTDVGVQVARPTVADGLAVAKAETDKLTAALQAAGVQPADMQTTALWVYPRTDASQQVVGYSVSSTVHVRVRDLSKANTTLDAAAAAVGNDITFGGIQLTRLDLTAQLAQARQAAIAAATSQAGEWARLSNRGLGKISGIQEQYAGYGPETVQGGGGIGGAGGGAVPQVQVGQGETVVVVTVTYALN